MRKCDYCGRESDESVTVCSGCGCPLVKPLTAGTSRGEQMPRVSADALFECGVGLLGLAMGHPPSAIHILKGLSELDDNSKVPNSQPPSPDRLLQLGEHLECGDHLRSAAAVYEYLVAHYPESRAAIQARASLQALRTAYPEQSE